MKNIQQGDAKTVVAQREGPDQEQFAFGAAGHYQVLPDYRPQTAKKPKAGQPAGAHWRSRWEVAAARPCWMRRRFSARRVVRTSAGSNRLLLSRSSSQRLAMAPSAKPPSCKAKFMAACREPNPVPTERKLQ